MSLLVFLQPKQKPILFILKFSSFVFMYFLVYVSQQNLKPFLDFISSMGWQLHGSHGHSHGGGGHSGHGHSENLNVRAAFIHVLGDVLQSIGVFCAAIIIYFKPTWQLADPICTFVFSIIVLWTTITILKEAILVSRYDTHRHSSTCTERFVSAMCRANEYRNADGLDVRSASPCCHSK